MKLNRIKEKLDELVLLHEELLEDLPDEDIFYKERLTRRGVEKTIELIADTILDVVLQIISEEGYSRPADSRGAVAVLQEKKILTVPLSHQLQDLVSFRNLLVHRYGKVDQKEEYENINHNHADVLRFVKEIESYLKSKPKASQQLKRKTKT